MGSDTRTIRTRIERVRAARAVLALALLCALPFAAPARAPNATRVIGTVRVQERALFSGLRERDDRSGVVVYLTGFAASSATDTVKLGQRDERFEPKVLPIVVGQKVEFPNYDRLYHNVFSVSPVKSFDLGQYKSSDSPRSVVFDEPGLVPVFCNIHPHMISYVVVLENPSWAITGVDGGFELRGAPPGRVTVNAWFPGAQHVSREVVLADGDPVQVDLELQVTDRIEPHTRKDGSPYPRPGTEHQR
jgi:plastocyanin